MAKSSKPKKKQAKKVKTKETEKDGKRPPVLVSMKNGTFELVYSGKVVGARYTRHGIPTISQAKVIAEELGIDWNTVIVPSKVDKGKKTEKLPKEHARAFEDEKKEQVEPTKEPEVADESSG